MDSGMYQEFSATEFVDMFPQTNGDILVHTILVWIVPDDRHQSGPIEPCGDCGSFVPTETKAGMKVSNLYISQVKRKCGIEVGKNYNLPKMKIAGNRSVQKIKRVQLWSIEAF